MSRATTVLSSAVYAALAIADSVAAGRGGSTAARRLRYVLKPALMPVLAAAFLDGTRGRGFACRHRPAPRRDGSGQAFSWGGDVALLGTSERSFLTGVGSFSGRTSPTSPRSCRCAEMPRITTPRVSRSRWACG